MPVRPLSKDLEEKARSQLNEDPKRLESDLQHIKDWLTKQPHIRARMDDQFLVAFLRGCKSSLERTKEKLDAHYTMKTLLKDYFENRDPMSPEIQHILNIGLFTPLREPDDCGRRVLLMRPGISNPAEVKMPSMFKVNLMIADIMIMEDDANTIAGNVGVCDMTGISIGHVTQITPTLMKQSMVCTQEAYPLRPKGVHYINSPSFFETAYNLMKSMATEKLRKRIFIHSGDMEPLYKHVPKRILPKEYGGEAGPIADITKEWKSKVESYRDWFLEDSKYGVDESKRPGKPKTYEDLFGMEGSFRQLSVD